MGIIDFYYCSEFKKDNESYYNFNVPIDVNIDLKQNEKIKFKLIDFSIINSMLTISNAHKNNSFRVIYNSYEIQFLISDGSYTAISLKDYINQMFNEEELPINLNYDKKTNKYYFVITGNMEFYPDNIKKLLGFQKNMYSFINNNSYYAENFANMLPYSKIIISSDLAFNNMTVNNFISKYSSYSGISDIITWVNRDCPLFSTINYNNNQNLEIELSNKNLTNINFYLMNEYKEFIEDAPPCSLHFQLIIYDNINWYKRFYKLLNEIYYSILSFYFRRYK